MIGARLTGGLLAERVDVVSTVGADTLTVTGGSEDQGREFRAVLRSAINHTLGGHPLGSVVCGSLGELLPAALALCGFSGGAAVGELALDGRVRPVRGALVLGEALEGLSVFCCREDARALWEGGARPVVVETLRDALAWVPGEAADYLPPVVQPYQRAGVSVTHIRGQLVALEGAARAIGAGRPVVLVGPPGTGKTLIARGLHGLIDSWGEDDGGRFESSRIHSVAGIASQLLSCRPFRAPHHTASSAAMVGGGSSRAARPGEISLAHGGVLFLDELPEFAFQARDVLRHVLRAGSVSLARADGVITFPARPLAVIATANPCPCGYHGWQSLTGRRCQCPALSVERYGGRLRDWVDGVGAVVINVPPVTAGILQAPESVVTEVDAGRLRALALGVAS